MRQTEAIQYLFWLTWNLLGYIASERRLAFCLEGLE